MRISDWSSDVCSSDLRGIDPASTSLRIGIFGAEPWTEAMRAEVETAFAIKAVDIYGLSEVMGPGVASEYAATQDGPTIWEDHFYPEIIDHETGDRKSTRLNSSP